MYHLDDLDMRILRELGGTNTLRWNVRESFSNIARKLGVDEETIRVRVTRMRERGLLPTWRMVINPQLIGCHAANVELSVREESEKVDAISEIKGIDGVNSITDFRGKDLYIGMYYEDDGSLDKSVQRMESICQSQKTAVWESLFPAPEVKMNRLYWGIINEMESDARRDLEQVAKLLNISSRSVQRRLSAILDGKAVYLARPPNVSAVGGLMCHFVIFCPDPNKKHAADGLIQSSFHRIGISDTSPEQYSLIGISCENFAEADKILESLKVVDGVESVRMRVVKEIIVVPDWLKKQIEKRL